jgi:hypothetical protein
MLAQKADVADTALNPNYPGTLMVRFAACDPSSQEWNESGDTQQA